MAEMSKECLEELKAQCLALQSSRKTLLLSTLSQDGVPEISYAPYGRGVDGCFYIFISELAAHTASLLHHPLASALFIREESETKNLFARERLSYRCSVREVMRDTEEYDAGLECLAVDHANMIAMLRTLPDFRLFALLPEQGSYVVGFGKAFDVDPKSGDLLHRDQDRLKG